MPPILLQCQSCKRIFSSGINLGVGATATLKGNVSQCPFCKSMENIPDGTFKGTVKGIVKILEQSDSPLSTAKDLLDALEKSRTPEDLAKIKQSSKFAKFKKWIPNTPEKLAAYIAIIYTIIQLLIKSPRMHIEYNETFVKIYNQKIETLIVMPKR